MDINKIAENFSEMNYGGTIESPYVKAVATFSFISGYNHNRWVSVETPPENPGRYLTYDKEGHICVGHYGPNSDRSKEVAFWDNYNHRCGFYEYKIEATHYMPLPTPPNQ